MSSKKISAIFIFCSLQRVNAYRLLKLKATALVDTHCDRVFVSLMLRCLQNPMMRVSSHPVISHGA